MLKKKISKIVYEIYEFFVIVFILNILTTVIAFLVQTLTRIFRPIDISHAAARPGYYVPIDFLQFFFKNFFFITLLSSSIIILLTKIILHLLPYEESLDKKVILRIVYVIAFFEIVFFGMILIDEWILRLSGISLFLLAGIYLYKKDKPMLMFLGLILIICILIMEFVPKEQV